MWLCSGFSRQGPNSHNLTPKNGGNASDLSAHKMEYLHVVEERLHNHSNSPNTHRPHSGPKSVLWACAPIRAESECVGITPPLTLSSQHRKMDRPHSLPRPEREGVINHSEEGCRAGCQGNIWCDSKRCQGAGKSYSDSAIFSNVP